MSWFGWLTGDNKSVNSVIDGVKSGIDYAVFTEQEKKESNQKLLDWTLEYHKATSGQSIARRIIAWVIVVLWALLILLSVLSQGVALFFDSDPAKQFSQFVFEILKEVVNNPFMIVIGFYFATHMVKGFKSK